MGYALRSLYFCGLCSILTGSARAQHIKAAVNVLGIDLRENDRGWKVEDSTSRSFSLLNGDVIVRVAGQDVARVGALSIAALLEYAQVQNLTMQVERAGKETELSLFSPAAPGGNEDSRGLTALGVTFRSLEDTQRIIVTEILSGRPA